MKYFYFIRHGESMANAGIAGGVGTDSGLSPKGITQAGLVAKRCTHLPIELIISITMNRAIETAKIINNDIHVPIEFQEMFIERRGPSEFNGKSEKDWNEIRKTIKGYFYEHGFRHSDEENFEDIIVRGGKCLEYLKSKTENHILVITHGSFLRDLISLAIFDMQLTPGLRRMMTKGFTTVNTGLTVMTYNQADDRWSLLTWNDHAHLG